MRDEGVQGQELPGQDAVHHSLNVGRQRTDHTCGHTLNIFSKDAQTSSAMQTA